MQKPVKPLFCKLYIYCIFSTFTFLSGTCWAQSEEEIQLLHLFYKDKDLVVSSTRNEKNISQVADNITIITADEIEAMNAHTVAEVLNHIPGIFIGSPQDSMAAHPGHILFHRRQI